MSAEISTSDIHKAVTLIRNAQQTVALSGAGISTPSGIPDFRSSGSGLWERYDPMKVASLTAFRHHPDSFFEWARPMAEKILTAKPNEAHIALARLEKEDYLAGIITQNIDNLHHRAGSSRVLEIHGNIREATCVRCFNKVSATGHIEIFIKGQAIPRCEKCGGILKPNIILFGEQLPMDTVREAQKLICSSDLILVIGSSLEVTPVALFPVQALNSGAQLIIINQEATYLDERAVVLFHHDAAKVLPLIVSEVLNE